MRYPAYARTQTYITFCFSQGIPSARWVLISRDGGPLKPSLTIPPGVVHAFRNSGDSAMVFVSFSTNLHDPAGADTEREQIL